MGKSKRFISLLLSLMLFVSVMQVPQNVSAKPNEVQQSSAQTMVTQASSTTVTVTKADDKTVKKIDSLLMKEKAFKLKIKGNKKAAQKIYNDILKKIKKVNKQDIIFQYEYYQKVGKYYIYNVNKESAKLYKYSVKFAKKIFSTAINVYKKSYMHISELKDDYKKFGNMDKYRLRLVYESIVNDIIRDTDWLNQEGYEVTVEGADDYITKAYKYAGIFDYYNETFEFLRPEDPILDWENKTVTINIKSFEEFSKWKYAKKAANNLAIKEKSSGSTTFTRFDLTDLDMKILNGSSMCQFSDAVKIWILEKSRYFNGGKKRTGYMMVYDLKSMKFYSPSKTMKLMLDNKAKGVCMHFASNEVLLFEQWGMTAYYNSAYEINHAWSVVKVKNSKGKTLWIPFDYGIGPHPYLNVDSKQKKYINTEAKRYKLYFRGIKGAPKKKNFKDSDFN